MTRNRSIVDADRRKYKRNKFLAYIWLGSLGLLVAGALCFVPSSNAPAMAKNIIFVCGYVLWDAFYTVANVPYGSLLSLISDEPGDRASLSAWRSVGSLVGQMATMALLPLLIYDESNNIVGIRVFAAALVMGVLGFLAFQFMIRNTVIRVESNVKVSEEKRKFNVLKAVGNFLKNRPAVELLWRPWECFLVCRELRQPIRLCGSPISIMCRFQDWCQCLP